MADQTTKLDVHARTAAHSRATRRLRRAGQVPGVLYGGDAEPLAFAVDERELRHALAARGAVVALELVGGEDVPGTKEGGVLEHVIREVNIEALPTDIPERLELDVSQMQVNDTLNLSEVTAPSGVTILDDLEETVVATLTPPKLQAELEALEEEALEQETALVGEGEEPAEGEEAAEGAAEGEAPAEGGGEAAEETSE